MRASRPSVVVTRRLPEAIETRMREIFDVRLRETDAPMTEDELVAAMAGAEVLVPTLTERVTADMLGRARAVGGRLRLIANYGAGIDHIDVAAARALQIAVTNTPGAVTDDTADMTIALILAVTRRLPEGQALMQGGQWSGWAPNALLGRRLRGQALGILGMGRIGQAVARRARAFGLSVHYHNRSRLHPAIEAETGATWWQSLDQMAARVDVLSVNCPATPATFHLMNARRLKLMKPTAVIVNTSRGDVIDENAMTRMLRTGDIAGAGLDVYTRGGVINPRLRALPNVVLLPHMASATIEARMEMGEKVLINIRAFTDGHRPPDLVLLGMD